MCKLELELTNGFPSLIERQMRTLFLLFFSKSRLLTMAFETLCNPDSPLPRLHLASSAPATWPLESLNIPSFLTTGPLHRVNALLEMPSPAAQCTSLL